MIDELARYRITAELLSFDQVRAFQAVSPLGASDPFIAEANNLPAVSLGALYPFSYSSRLDRKGIPIGATNNGGNRMTY